MSVDPNLLELVHRTATSPHGNAKLGRLAQCNDAASAANEMNAFLTLLHDNRDQVPGATFSSVEPVLQCLARIPHQFSNLAAARYQKLVPSTPAPGPPQTAQTSTTPQEATVNMNTAADSNHVAPPQRPIDVEALLNAYNAVKHELARYKDANDQYSKWGEQVASENAALKATARTVTQQLQQSEQIREQTRNELKTANLIINEIKQQMSDISARNVAFTNSLGNNSIEIERLKSLVGKLSNDLETEKRKGMTLAKQFSDLMKKYDQLKRRWFEIKGGQQQASDVIASPVTAPGNQGFGDGSLAGTRPTSASSAGPSSATNTPHFVPPSSPLRWSIGSSNGVPSPSVVAPGPPLVSPVQTSFFPSNPHSPAQSTFSGLQQALHTQSPGAHHPLYGPPLISPQQQAFPSSVDLARKPSQGDVSRPGSKTHSRAPSSSSQVNFLEPPIVTKNEEIEVDQLFSEPITNGHATAPSQGHPSGASTSAPPATQSIPHTGEQPMDKAEAAASITGMASASDPSGSKPTPAAAPTTNPSSDAQILPTNGLNSGTAPAKEASVEIPRPTSPDIKNQTLKRAIQSQRFDLPSVHIRMLGTGFESIDSTSESPEHICVFCYARLSKTGVTKDKMDRHPNDVQRLLDHVKEKHPKIYEKASKEIKTST